MAGALDGMRILDLSWGIAGPARGAAARRAGRRRDQGGAARRRPVPRLRRATRSGPQPRRSVDARPEARTPGSRCVPRASSPTADVLVESVPPRRDGPARPRLRRCSPSGTPRSCTARARPTRPGTALADRPGYDALVQACQGQQWEQPGWRTGPDPPAHADAEHGRVFLAAERDPRRAHRPRADRPRPARATTRCSRACSSTRPRSGSTSRRRPAAVPRPDGQELPARRPPGDDLRVRRRRVGARVGDERPDPDRRAMDELLGLEPPPTDELRPTADPAAGADERRGAATRSRAGPRRARRRAPRDHIAVEAVITMEEALEHVRIPSSSPTAWWSTVDDPELGPPPRSASRSISSARRATIRGPQPPRRRAQRRGLGRARGSRAELVT